MWIELKGPYKTPVNLNLIESFQVFKSEVRYFPTLDSNSFYVEKFETKSEAQARYEEIKGMLLGKPISNLPPNVEEAFKEANNIIYLNDNSDYLGALYEVCKLLKPDFDEDEIGVKYID